MTKTSAKRQSVSIAIVGSGGAGAMTAGAILLEAAGKAGMYGLMTRSVGPQIRGGEAVALLRLADHPVECMDERYDLLIAIDWRNADRFAAEIPMAGGGVIVSGPEAGDVPAAFMATGAGLAVIDLKELAGAIEGGRENMIAAGIAAAMAGLPEAAVMAAVGDKLSTKGDATEAAGRACIAVGMACASTLPGCAKPRPAAPDARGARWLITGNEATGLGAIRGGVRFAAAYPITPATEVLEWLAPALNDVGGTLVQAEDELASVNMAIGASFGGRPAITATSGPGLSLMMESLGLAVAAEVPIVVVDVMRCGPSTGIATKSEQSDLNIAVYGLHGDAPHVVVAPLSVADCLHSAQWAVHLAEAMQVPVILLSDQSLGQARVLMERPADISFLAERRVWREAEDTSYNRYALTADGVSPMALPGIAGGQYTADGLTHTESGAPSATGADQQAQMDKRRDKVEGFNYAGRWGEVTGAGDTVILTWGSRASAAREAVRELRDEGTAVKLVAMRLLSPFPTAALKDALEGARRILIVEQSHSGQFHHYLRAMTDLPGEVRRLNRPGPHPIGPGEIAKRIREWNSA